MSGGLGADSVVVNGQLVALPQTYQFNPPSFGPQTTGVPNISPAYPPFMAGAAAMTNTPGTEAVGGYGTANNNGVMTSAAHNAPWNPRVSPLPWALAALLIGLGGLHFFHWREVIDAQAGPFKGDESTEG